MAVLLAGLPPLMPGATVNRLCGSGLEAVIGAARAMALGDASICVAGGVKSMSRADPRRRAVGDVSGVAGTGRSTAPRAGLPGGPPESRHRSPRSCRSCLRTSAAAPGRCPRRPAGRCPSAGAGCPGRSAILGHPVRQIRARIHRDLASGCRRWAKFSVVLPWLRPHRRRPIRHPGPGAVPRLGRWAIVGDNHPLTMQRGGDQAALGERDLSGVDDVGGQRPSRPLPVSDDYTISAPSSRNRA
jgi:hypothetical protein